MPDSLLATLLHWAPALLRGLSINIGISLLAVGLGTVAGLAVGTLHLSPLRPARRLARWYVIALRNVPWLVLVYGMSYTVPFEIVLRGHVLPFPDWLKVTLALPASAHVAEIFHGAVLSIPSTQWEAAASLAFGRREILWRIVLPQCVRRMLPSWMNLYAVITMGTALASLVGVHDLLDTAQIASNTVNRTPFTVVTYFTVLGLFFLYCYPIARLTRRLEHRHVVA
ncbi:amino acid ABC transporter permease [Ralstonia syzygii]|uniref:amino acid ABC transporter permease n=1 Tax=Ralstonia syzygii TaxID=28097 RepID=UPI0018D169B5|nr:amino acid ABC transporter permease [Ralstonia syzygii]